MTDRQTDRQMMDRRYRFTPCACAWGNKVSICIGWEVYCTLLWDLVENSFILNQSSIIIIDGKKGWKAK